MKKLLLPIVIITFLALCINYATAKPLKNLPQAEQERVMQIYEVKRALKILKKYGILSGSGSCETTIQRRLDKKIKEKKKEVTP